MKKNVNKEKIKELKDTNKVEKALFIQRFSALIIDVLIVSLIASLIVMPFADVKKADKLSNESAEIMQDYMTGKINFNTYTLKFISNNYNAARNNGILSIVSIILEILYFVVYQIYNNGQTIGKKIMKIKVVSNSDDELTMNQMIFRSLIANSILFEIIHFL